ncbi:aldolase/citrate lyase family protein [Streptacidiphilus monticola]
MKRAALGGARPVLYHQSLPSASLPEWAAAAGYDGVIVDLQHGEVGLEAACGILRAVPRRNPYAYARVGSLDPAPILRLLDSGARGIVAPTVESRTQAEALVAATKYPPIGNRSLGPSRPALYPGTPASRTRTPATARCPPSPRSRRGPAWTGPRRSSRPRPGLRLHRPGRPRRLLRSARTRRLGGRPGPGGDHAPAPADDRARCHPRHLLGQPAYTAGLFAEGLVDYAGLGIDLVLLNRGFTDTIAGLGSARSTAGSIS